MWCFEIRNRETKEVTLIFGYSWKNAFKRSNLNPDEWDIISEDYED